VFVDHSVRHNLQNVALGSISDKLLCRYSFALGTDHDERLLIPTINLLSALDGWHIMQITICVIQVILRY